MTVIVRLVPLPAKTRFVFGTRVGFDDTAETTRFVGAVSRS